MSIKELIANTLELPREIVLNLPSLKIVGDREINIENHQGIVEYTNELLRIKTSIGIIKVIGMGLIIGEINKEELFITGTVQSISFCN